VFVEKLSGTLVTIAKDVKIQVEFNPARVAAYRLIGYENRALAAQDFNDDRKDAGEIGAGHTVTALYEVVPAGQEIPAGPGVNALRYQTPQAAAQNEAPKAIAPAGEAAHVDEMLLVKLRYKEPSGDTSKLLEFPLKNQLAESPSADLKFASAVAAFGKFLRGENLGLDYDAMMQLAQAGLAASDDPRRSEMIHLMLQARPLIGM
jgi:Ca-activated chloride channel family protein